MTESFKQQLQELINRAAALKYTHKSDCSCKGKHISHEEIEVFKQGCELLIPVLMKAVEQRDNVIKAYQQYDMVSDYESNLCDKDLLNILKGE